MWIIFLVFFYVWNGTVQNSRPKSSLGNDMRRITKKRSGDVFGSAINYLKNIRRGLFSKGMLEPWCAMYGAKFGFRLFGFLTATGDNSNAPKRVWEETNEPFFCRKRIRVNVRFVQRKTAKSRHRGDIRKGTAPGGGSSHGGIKRKRGWEMVDEEEEEKLMTKNLLWKRCNRWSHHVTGSCILWMVGTTGGVPLDATKVVFTV